LVVWRRSSEKLPAPGSLARFGATKIAELEAKHRIHVRDEVRGGGPHELSVLPPEADQRLLTQVTGIDKTVSPDESSGASLDVRGQGVVVEPRWARRFASVGRMCRAKHPFATEISLPVIGTWTTALHSPSKRKKGAALLVKRALQRLVTPR
jgi:hypothetical protein